MGVSSLLVPVLVLFLLQTHGPEATWEREIQLAFNSE